MALRACKECGKEISDQAKTCPSCGKNQKMGCLQIGCLIFMGGVVFVFLLSAWASACGHKTTESTNTLSTLDTNTTLLMDYVGQQKSNYDASRYTVLSVAEYKAELKKHESGWEFYDRQADDWTPPVIIPNKDPNSLEFKQAQQAILNKNPNAIGIVTNNCSIAVDKSNAVLFYDSPEQMVRHMDEGGTQNVYGMVLQGMRLKKVGGNWPVIKFKILDPHYIGRWKGNGGWIATECLEF